MPALSPAACPALRRRYTQLCGVAPLALRWRSAFPTPALSPALRRRSLPRISCPIPLPSPALYLVRGQPSSLRLTSAPLPVEPALSSAQCKGRRRRCEKNSAGAVRKKEFLSGKPWLRCGTKHKEIIIGRMRFRCQQGSFIRGIVEPQGRNGCLWGKALFVCVDGARGER